MAEFTPNFNLKKPMKDEFYNIEDFNGNMDIIDEALKNAGQSEQLESDVTEIKNDIGSPSDISSSPTIFGKLAEIKETLTTKFSEIISKITSIDSKIGTTTDTGGTSSAGGIFAKLNKLLTDWTTTRASRIDSIYTNTTTNNTASTTGTLSQKLSSIISTISSILTDTNSTDSKIGTTTDTGGTSSAGSVFAKLNKLITDWTSTRASRVDTIYNNTLTSSTSSSTGTLSQKLNYIKNLIGTNSDTGDTTIFGKLNNKKYPTPSDTERIILLDKTVTINRTNGTENGKLIYLKKCEPLKSGIYKLKVYYSIKIDEENSNTFYNRFPYAVYDKKESNVSMETNYNFKNIIASDFLNYSEGTVGSIGTSLVPGYLIGSRETVATTTEKTWISTMYIKVGADNYVPYFVLKVNNYSNLMTGYIKFTKVVLCFDEEEY